MEKSLQVYDANVSVYAPQNFEHAQRVAKALSESDMVPSQYQKNLPNCILALELANRLNTSPFFVMQNVSMIKGKPSWSSSYIISAIQTSGRYKSTRFELGSNGEAEFEATVWVNKSPQKKKLKLEDLTCRFIAIDQHGNELKGSKISVGMAIAEGWYTKDGSKWPTMTEQMLMYRAASFFGRVYCPDIMLGMRSRDEILDMVEPEIIDTDYKEESTKALEKVKQAAAKKATPPPPKDVEYDL